MERGDRDMERQRAGNRREEIETWRDREGERGERRVIWKEE